MTFVVSSKPTFTAPVVAHIPADGGRTQRIQFSVVFKALDKAGVDELIERIRTRAKAGADDGAAALKDRDIIDELLVGFGPDLLEEDRTPMAYTPGNVDRVCSIWPLESAIVKSFFDNYITAGSKN
jgi:hypothetical protein